MRVHELTDALNLKTVALPEPEREIKGAYIGDLLSWVMGRAESGNVWITIMSNINVLAVASLSDVACVILAEGVTLDGEIAEAASQRGINVFSSDRSIYELALLLGKLI